MDWKRLAKKDLLPPFKPHLGDSSAERRDPWAGGDVAGSPSFEYLDDSEQEYFQNFSYVSPTEMARSRSSPVVRYLHLNERKSGNFGTSPSQDSPRRRMIKSPAFAGLSSMADAVEGDEETSRGQLDTYGSLRRQRRRWSLSNFRVGVSGEPDESNGTTSGNEDTPQDNSTSSEDSPPASIYIKEDEKKKVKGKGFLKSIFGKSR